MLVDFQDVVSDREAVEVGDLIHSVTDRIYQMEANSDTLLEIGVAVLDGHSLQDTVL